MIHEIKDLKIFHSSYLALLGFDQKQHVEVKKYSVKEKFVKSQQRKKSSNRRMKKNRQITMARLVIILTLLAAMTECGLLKNNDNLPSTDRNKLEAEVKSLRKDLRKLITVLKQQAEDISNIRSSKEKQIDIVSLLKQLKHFIFKL